MSLPPTHSFRKEVGLDLFFPKQMQENLKVRKPLGKEPRETPFVLASWTGANGIGLGILGKARASVLSWTIWALHD